MDELRRLRGLLATALENVDDLSAAAERKRDKSSGWTEQWETAFRGATMAALEQLRDTITAIEPAYEVALLRCERDSARD